MLHALSFFKEIKDPRINRTKLHSFTDIIGLTLCATLGSATGWESIYDFGVIRIDWLRQFLWLKNGIPSSDTIRRVISRIDPKEFQESFIAWTKDISKKVEGVVAIDGKTVKNKRDPNPIHLVSAWANENEGICLGQIACEEKSNEITAIPILLESLEISGSMVTIDAMGCQKKIATKIIEENKADYCLSVKKNHPKLHSELEDHFKNCDGDSVDGFRKKETIDKAHGRKEIRLAYVSKNINLTPLAMKWPALASVGMIISKRDIKGEISITKRYFICSKPMSAKSLLETVRDHWGIENKLHWVLDVVFREDGNLVAKDHGQKNLALARKVALSILKQEESKISMKRKMFRATHSPEFMEKILAM